MNGKNSKPYAIMVFGVPMSGKTQFATKFSRKFRAPLLNFESIPGISRKIFLSVVAQIADSQQNLVIDHGIDTYKQREELRRTLHSAGYRVVIVWIQTDVNTIKRRLRSHLKSVERAKSYFEALLDQLEAPEDSEDTIVLSGKHTFDGQLKTVLSALSKNDS
ncbi:ATP-binding protein [Candidatus Saccharibacteria bacterium]|nr:ATP-binding protein [Candidatus Saccharibacteria bacterium]